MEDRKQFDLELGRFLYDIRKTSKMNKNEIGKLLDTTSVNVGLIERGRRLPSVEILLRYAKIFNLDVRVLMEKRIETVKNTVLLLEDETPTHIQNEYQLILHYEALLSS